MVTVSMAHRKDQVRLAGAAIELRDAPTEEATLMRYLNEVIPSANAQNEQ